MKKLTDGDSIFNLNKKSPKAKLWTSIICIALCFALAIVALIVSNNKIVELNTVNGDLETLVAELVSELDSLNKELNQSNERQEDLNNKLAALEEQLVALQNSNQLSQNENEQLKAEIANLKEQLEAHQRPPEDKIRIYIDQGHNPLSYHNSGAYGNGLYEHDVTFLIGTILAEILKTDGRFEVELSRPNKSVVLGTDGKSSIMARVEGAIAFDADYLISLHTNSYTTDGPSGIEVWTANETGEAYVFGETLLEGLVESTNLKNRGMNSDLELDILEYSPMPSVILEMGFISNVNDATLLSEHPELFAQGIYNGILDYFGLLPYTSIVQ